MKVFKKLLAHLLFSLALGAAPVEAVPIFSLVFSPGECATPGSPIAICGAGGSGGSGTPVLISPSVSLGATDLYVSQFEIGPLEFQGNVFVVGAFTLMFEIGDTSIQVLVDNMGNLTGSTQTFLTPIHVLPNSMATGSLYATGPAIASFNFSGTGFGNLVAAIMLTEGAAPSAAVPEPGGLVLALSALAGLVWVSRQERPRPSTRWPAQPVAA